MGGPYADKRIRQTGGRRYNCHAGQKLRHPERMSEVFDRPYELFDHDENDYESAG